MRTNHSIPQRIPGRVIGSTLRKKVSVRNRLRAYGQGYALSLAQLIDAEAHGANIVELEERETGQKFRAGVRFLRERGTPLHFKGYEPQIALALSLWTSADPSQPEFFSGGTA